MTNMILIALVVIVIAVVGWLWYTNTPEYRAAQATKAAKDAALASTSVSPVGLQRGVNDVLDAAKAQRDLGVDIDPGLEAIKLVRNAYQDVPPKWNELRSTDISDPVKRVNIMNNLEGMVEAAIQLFVRTIPYISSQAGIDAAKQLYFQMATDSNDRRNCWWGRQTGCWRNWSVAEPHEDARVDAEQARLRDLSRRILPDLEARAKAIHAVLFTQSDLNRLHNEIHGDPTRQNDYAEQTFAQIVGWVH